MLPVALVRCPSYDSPVLEEAVARAVDLAGGMARYVSPGQRVLVKPNLLAACPPEKAVTTHPAVVATVCRLVLEAGGKPFLADSPALDPFGRVAKKSGLAQVAEELGLELLELGEPTRVAVAQGSPRASLELARAAVEAPVIISLPKLKTHTLMLLTLGVKNLFGTVVAQRKAEWHFMVGLDRDNFAGLLLDIWGVLRPALTILDGVWGMEGLGPNNGTPRHWGLVAASPDALALDATVGRFLEVDPGRWPLLREAARRGLLTPERQAPELLGDPWDAFPDRGITLPALDSLDMLPRPLNWLVRRYAVSKPAQEDRGCVECGKCAAVCPAHALTLTGRHAIFDYKACIRCYCCQEVCPQGAISFKKGLLVRLLNAVGR
ncbi:MAG: DUF362 domain-containing protein [Deltaproteobacteria bacterium]|nr:DUF362 domain-containing protein [Deltaproteobacteria bacterium]